MTEWPKSKVTAVGQTTIPKFVRDFWLRIEVADYVQFRRVKGKVIIEKATMETPK